jgi:hypothetical protein
MEIYRVMRCRGSHIFQTTRSKMAVRLSTLHTHPTDEKLAECEHVKKKRQRTKKNSEAESFKHMKINI